MRYYVTETILKVGPDYEYTLNMLHLLDKLNMIQDYYLTVGPYSHMEDKYGEYIARRITVRRKPYEQ